MPILKSEISGTFWKCRDRNHTHNILQKWLSSHTIVLNVFLYKTTTLFPRALFQIWYLFYLFLFYFFLYFFGIYLCILRKKKKRKEKNPNLKRSNGDNCAFFFFCVVILCECLKFHTQKKPLSWQLFSAIRYAVCIFFLGNPSLGGGGVKWFVIL